MKLRMYNDSLRLRLTPADVAQLAESGRIAAETVFSESSKLAYVLSASESVSSVCATFGEGIIRVEIPADLALSWAASDTVSLQAGQSSSAGRILQIVIEKDFECLDPRGNEPGVAFYPNPLKRSEVEARS